MDKEPSSSERSHRARKVAIDSAAGAVGGVAGFLVAGPIGAAGGAAAGGAVKPVASAALSRLATLFNRQRTDAAEQLLDDAARLAGMTVDEFVDVAADDPAKTLLAGSAVSAAAQTLYGPKLKALAAATARGVLGQTAVDEELLVVNTLTELEEVHVQVLLAIAKEEPARYVETDHAAPHLTVWDAAALLERFPDLQAFMASVLAVLERVGGIVLVPRDWISVVSDLEDRLNLRIDVVNRNDTPRNDRQDGVITFSTTGPLIRRDSAGALNPSWRVSRFGLQCLALLDEIALETDEASETPPT